MWFLVVLFVIIVYLLSKNENQANELLNYKIKELSAKYDEEFKDADFYNLLYYWKNMKIKITKRKNALIASKINRFKNDGYLELLAEYHACFNALINTKAPDYADPLDVCSISYEDDDFEF